jgi:predicted enzyme related to lactoylglutathione lyase
MRRVGSGLPDRRIRRQTLYFTPHKGLRRGLGVTSKIFRTPGRFSPAPNVEVIQKRTSEYSPNGRDHVYRIGRRRKMANAFVHTELNTTDVGKAKAFYSKLFDWKLEDMAGGMEYTLIKVGENTAGGIMPHPVPGAPSMWLSYVNVDDIKASTAKAKSLGATLIRDVTEIPNVGSFSIFTDPTGAMLALFQAKMQ